MQPQSDLQHYFHTILPEIEAEIQEQLNSLNSLVFPVADHVLGSGGKRLRPMLCILVAGAMGLRDRSVYSLASALELVHSATLLHDDILDNAELRRGKEASHLVFGEKQTILAGDALLARANRIVSEYGDTRLVECLSEAIYSTATGEILEIQKMMQTGLSSEEYLEIIKGKTAYLIQSSCESGAILAGVDSEWQQTARELGINLGVAFQLVDDALDYTPSLELGKPMGGDLREGKITLPLLYLLHELEPGEHDLLMERIKGRFLSEQEMERTMGRIRERQLHTRARSEAESYLAAAHQALATFPASEEKKLLSQMLEYIRCREN